MSRYAIAPFLMGFVFSTAYMMIFSQSLNPLIFFALLASPIFLSRAYYSYRTKKVLEQNPKYARLYLSDKDKKFGSPQVSVITVNGKKPFVGFFKSQYLLLLEPGNNWMVVNFSHSKALNTQYAKKNTAINLFAENGKDYQIQPRILPNNLVVYEVNKI